MKRSLLLLGLCSFFLSANAQLLAPDLVAPKQDSTDANTTLLFDWHPAQGGAVTSYELQVDTDTNFTTADSYTTPFSSGSVAFFDFNTKYFWRVRGIGPSGNSPWSDTRKFTTYSDKLQMTDPADSATISSVEANLKWFSVEPVINYIYQLDTSASFNSPARVQGTLINPTFATDKKISAVKGGLAFNQLYYWRVAPYHQNDTDEWSDTRRLITAATVTLQEIADSATGIAPDSFLRAALMNGVEEYEFEIDITPAFNPASPEYDTDRLDTNMFDFKDRLFGERYYWRARGINGTGVSAWTKVRVFTIATTIQQSSPEDGGIASLQPILKWVKMSGVTKYQVQFDDNPSFTSPQLLLPELAGDNYVTVPQPVEIGTYYWRVRGILASERDTSDWSAVRSVLAQPVGIEENNAPVVSAYPNPAKESVKLSLQQLNGRKLIISMVDLNGKEVVAYSTTVGSNSQMEVINVQHLSTGIYMLRVTDGTYHYAQKVTIEK